VSAAREADEGLLHEVLGRVAIVDEQTGEPHQRGRFLAEQLDDERVDVDRRVHAGERRSRGGVGHPQREGDSHLPD